MKTRITRNRFDVGDQMHSRADQYRRRGIHAKQRAAQASEPNIRQAFEDVAGDWFALAEQAEWLERHRQRPPEEGKPK